MPLQLLTKFSPVAVLQSFVREEVLIQTVEENSGHVTSPPASEDPCSDRSQVEENGPSGQSTSLSDLTGSVQTKWTRGNVLKLIDLHVQYEPMFAKPTTKKKYVWGLIAAQLNSEDFEVTAEKAEQKWENITKTFRDTVDHNNRSGNAPKQCPYFDELQQAYGYRPNVKPVFIGSAGSSNVRPTSPSSSEVSVKEDTETSSEEGGSNKRLKKVKRQSRNDIVIDFLREMKGDMAREQECLLQALNKQHDDRMQNEKKKLELIHELVKAMKK